MEFRKCSTRSDKAKVFNVKRVCQIENDLDCNYCRWGSI